MQKAGITVIVVSAKCDPCAAKKLFDKLELCKDGFRADNFGKILPLYDQQRKTHQDRPPKKTIEMHLAKNARFSVEPRYDCQTESLMLTISGSEAIENSPAVKNVLDSVLGNCSEKGTRN